MYDRSREQALSALLVGWAALASLAALPVHDAWHRWWFVLLAGVCVAAGSVGVWAVAAVVSDRVPFPRTSIVDTHAQHIALKDILVAAGEQLHRWQPAFEPAEATGHAFVDLIEELVAAAFGDGEASQFRSASGLVAEREVTYTGAGAYIERLIPRLDAMTVRKYFSADAWRARYEEAAPRDDPPDS